MKEIDINRWIEDILWSCWGWRRYVENDCDTACRDALEMKRIASAVQFVLRALGNNNSPETAAVVQAIIDRRAKLAGDQAVRATNLSTDRKIVQRKEAV